MSQLQQLLSEMTPSEAAQIIAAMAAEVFALLSDEERLLIISSMAGGQASDKISSMVHL